MKSNNDENLDHASTIYLIMGFITLFVCIYQFDNGNLEYGSIFLVVTLIFFAVGIGAYYKPIISSIVGYSLFVGIWIAGLVFYTNVFVDVFQHSKRILIFPVLSFIPTTYSFLKSLQKLKQRSKA